MLRAFLMVLLLAMPVLANDKQKAIDLSRKGDYEASEAVMVKITDRDPEYFFYRLINNYALNKKREAENYANAIIYGNLDVPIRYLDVAKLLMYDMETWKQGASDLDDISREMTKITDRLKNGKGGPQTQKIQRAVENRLKVMIKKIEDDREKAQEAAEAQQAEKDKERAQGQAEPAQDTIRGQEKGTGRVDQKRVREIAEVWGKLPEKERARAMVELTRNLPARDRAVIQAYFKELAKRSAK